MLALLIFVTIMVSTIAAEYEYQFGNYSLYHSENAYCGPYLHDYSGLLAGFVATYDIDDKEKDTRGYVGYNSDQTTIYVVFRGTTDVANWLTDLDAVMTDYPLCHDCSVHKGFLDAEQRVYPGVFEEVTKLKAEFPSYGIIVTGHSLGAALATLVSMDLIASGFSKNEVKLFNFGSPRIGDTNFAEFYSSAMLPDHFSRVTHHKDIVPHSPLHVRFTHIANEFYEADDTPFVVACEGFEDPECSYQWSVTSVSDHLLYMGVVLGGDGCVALQ